MGKLNKCPICETEFVTSREQKYYCSKECSYSGARLSVVNSYLRQKEEDKEKLKERDRFYYKRRKQSRPVECLIKSAKPRAKKLGLEFNITIDDLEIPEYCPVFGIKLKVNDLINTNDSYSLDRIDNTKGYIKGNVKVISSKANRLKSNMSIDDVKKLLKYMEENTR